MIFQIVNGLCWSAVGFLAGWYFGPNLKRRAEGETPQARRGRGAGVIIVVLAIISVTQVAFATWDQRQTAECQAAYNNDFATVLTQRSQWNNEDRAQLNELIRSLGAQGQERTAVNEYLAQVERNDKRRAALPLPELRDRDC